MNSVQIHLALTHVPVVLSIVGLVMLAISFRINNNMLTKISYTFLFVAGLAALPVYFSGEGAEDVVEKLPGVSEAIIEEHEDIAKIAMISIAVCGLTALAALLAARFKIAGGGIKIGVLLLALVSGGLMFQTAHLGGQIRHSEIRSDVAVQSENGKGEKQNAQWEKDDD